MAELRELGLAAAREAQARLMAAEDSKTFAEFSLAFGRLSRSVRQTLALQAKLERDRARLAREAHAEAVRREQAAVERRKDQVRATVARLIWTEVEGPEAERLIDNLDEFLEDDVLADDFAAHPVEAHVARLRAGLGLAANPSCASNPQIPLAIDSAWNPACGTGGVGVSSAPCGMGPLNSS